MSVGRIKCSGWWWWGGGGGGGGGGEGGGEGVCEGGGRFEYMV